MPRPNDPMTLDLTNAECIAYASTESDGRPRWSVLSVFVLGDKFVAQSEGMTSIEGERTKTRRIASLHLERALKLFDESDLGVAVSETAREWAESHAGEAPAVLSDHETLQRLYGEPSGRKGYSGMLAEDFGAKESTVRSAIESGNPIKVPLAAVAPFIDLARFNAAREARRG